MHKLKALIVIGATFITTPVLAVAPSDIGKNACSFSGGAIGCETNGSTLLSPDGFFGRLISVLILAVGAVSVVMIVIGALRYTLSGGDPSGTKSAKDTILYAIIGLVLSLAAYGIVGFILGRLG